MNASRSLFYLHQVHAAARLAEAVAQRDECVRLVCRPGASAAGLLDQAEAELSLHRLRCVRVHGSAAGELTLRDFIGQVMGQGAPEAEHGVLSDRDLQAGLAALTEPGEGHGRVALLVTEAHSLAPAALHTIQLACQSGPKLRVVLAGPPSLAAILAQDSLAYLRQRLTGTLELPALGREAAPDLPAPPPAIRRRAPWRAALGAVALLGLGAAAAGWWWHSAPPDVPVAEIPPADVPAAEIPRQVVAPPPALPPPAPLAPAPPAPALPPEPASQAAIPPPVLAVRHDPAAFGGAHGEPAPEPPAAEPVAAAPVVAEAARETPAAPLPVLAVKHDPEAFGAPGEAVLSEPVPGESVPAGRAPEPPHVRPIAPVPVTPVRVTPVPVTPLPSVDARRCRDIVLYVQLGKILSDADKQFLRDDCRTR